jgi:protein-S-isoprenylcysteine O-methyltransferase Ste14
MLAPLYPVSNDPGGARAGALMLASGVDIQARLVEEPYLKKVHGEKYEEYARLAGRFVPGVGTLR